MLLRLIPRDRPNFLRDDLAGNYGDGFRDGGFAARIDWPRDT
jgi:hypothetical protein